MCVLEVAFGPLRMTPPVQGSMVHEGGGGEIECVEGDGGGNEGGEGRKKKGGAGCGDGEGGGTLFPATHAHRADTPAVVPKEPAMAYEQHELGPAPPHPVYSMPEQDGEEP